ncbi:hypothetical protein [Sphingomonas sp. GC_Shp_3]|uniref:hypothetical protein n=1 Tax=Sphingomonas sp. GC_Shp_3 TaxID=2937383 RepID=UPI00226A4CF8|nr:hypothetical protein [Sphingomonas sp. GC_Shp_3]
MDAAEATEAFAQAILKAVDQLTPAEGIRLPLRAQICLTLLAATETLLEQSEMQGPVAVLGAQLGARARDALVEEGALGSARAQEVGEHIGRLLAENDRLDREHGAG